MAKKSDEATATETNGNGDPSLAQAIDRLAGVLERQGSNNVDVTEMLRKMDPRIARDAAQDREAAKRRRSQVTHAQGILDLLFNGGKEGQKFRIKTPHLVKPGQPYEFGMERIVIAPDKYNADGRYKAYFGITGVLDPKCQPVVEALDASFVVELTLQQKKVFDDALMPYPPNVAATATAIA